MSYMSKGAEKRQNSIVTLSDQSHKELKELQGQRQSMQDKHDEQTNGKTSLYASVQEMTEKCVVRMY